MKHSTHRHSSSTWGTREAAGKLLEEALTLPSLRRVTRDGAQALPVNMYVTDVDLMVVAPMPGLHPEDVDISVEGTVLSIKSGMRGKLENSKNYLRHEWHYGPYSRTIELPFAVDADKVNASYGNGMLTLAMPRAEASKSKHIKLQRLGPARGEFAGHGAKEFAREGHDHPVPGPETTAPIWAGRPRTHRQLK